MIDKRCLILLDILNNECELGYKVLSVEELALSMPNGYKCTAEGVLHCINALSAKEYISVKYQDEKEVCVCPLPKGRQVFENKIEEEIQKSKDRKCYFLYSMLGAVCGGAVVTAITAIVLLVTGAV